MAKLIKNKYYTRTGERKINSYMVSVAKSIVSEAGFNEDDEVKVYAKDGKIIIEKVSKRN